MMRPGIAIATAITFGAREAEAVGAAAAIELFHNALLIRDDIQDESEERRGRPTLHRLHGVPLAMNAGDGLMLLAAEPLMDALRGTGERVTRQALAASWTMARQSAEGQALELGWRDRNVIDLTDADYLGMVLKKTCWMSTIWPLQLGVLIGGRGRVDPESVARFGFFLGAAFQIQDDLLNLVADPAYGKERCGDLYEGKRTLMLIHVHRRAGAAQRRRLDAFLAASRAARSPEMVAEVHDLMVSLGAIDHARTVASAMAGAAQSEFDRAIAGQPKRAERDFLAGLIPWVFERT
jgi:geranylgeranyl diphosphate synthase type II